MQTFMWICHTKIKSNIVVIVPKMIAAILTSFQMLRIKTIFRTNKVWGANGSLQKFSRKETVFGGNLFNLRVYSLNLC